MEKMVVKVKRTDNKVHFEGISESNTNVSLPFDYAPPLGSGRGFGGLEVLLLSFAGCVSTTLIFLLGRMEKLITSFSATAEGIRTERPLSLKEIRFHICIESDSVTVADMQRAIMQAEAVSPVWQAIKNNVAVIITFDLKTA